MAVVYSLLLSLFVYKSIKIKELPKILLDSAEMTGIIIFLIGVSSIMCMGYGIYQYSGTGIYSTAFRKQQQPLCYPVPDQYYPSDRRNIYGYDTGLPDLHTDLPAGMYCSLE